MAQRYQVVPAAYVILRRPGPNRGPDEVLLQLRHNTGWRDGYWATAAAGHVEAGESVVVAAVREAAEELGVTVEPADLVALTAMHRTQGTDLAVDERVDFFFQCRRWQGQPRIVEPHKAADLRWFPLDALPEALVPHERVVLTTLGAGGPAPVTTYGFAQANSTPS